MVIFDAVRGWLRRRQAGRLALTRKAPDATHLGAPQWVLLESVGSASLGAMYTDLLRHARIPVNVQQWGAGSGAFGGVPVGVRLLVPSERLAEARAILHLGETPADPMEAGEDEG